jgi:hypothetical protein
MKKGVDKLIDDYRNIFKYISSYQTSDERKTQSEMEIPALIIAGPGLESAFGRKLIKTVLENDTLKSKIYFTGMLSGDAK